MAGATDLHGLAEAERRVARRAGPDVYAAGEFVRVGPLRGGGGGSAVLWAKITSIVSNVVKAKFADAEGNVDPQAEEFRVYVYATAAQGVTWGPVLTDASPRLVVGQYIQIVQMPVCGTERPAGWWMVGPPLALTCAPTGDAGGLDWLLANVDALRALVEGG